ncbi:MAG: hypothetical protein ACRCZL_02880, partial [Cetobacterium sp.]
MFEFGDKVCCMNYGWGLVVGVATETEFLPIIVKFSNGRLRKYTEQGKFTDDAKRCLYFEEIQIPESALVKK